MGDGFIAEFGSVVGAVNCAVEVQRGAESEQSERPAEHRLIFRIGINLGDVVVEGEDLLGDGIIVASRLEALCEPGGVLVSGTAFDQLQGKVEAPVEFVATRRVKNIARPVRTYRVRLDGKRSLWPRLRLQSPAANYVLGALAILAVGAAAFWWWTSEDTTSRETRHRRPAVRGSHRRRRHCATVQWPYRGYHYYLARYRGFDVIASNSVERYIAPVDIRSVGKALDVNYVLQGSVQKQDEHLRSSAKLVNAQSGAVTWSNVGTARLATFSLCRANSLARLQQGLAAFREQFLRWIEKSPA